MSQDTLKSVKREFLYVRERLNLSVQKKIDMVVSI